MRHQQLALLLAIALLCANAVQASWWPNWRELLTQHAITPPPQLKLLCDDAVKLLKPSFLKWRFDAALKPSPGVSVHGFFVSGSQNKATNKAIFGPSYQNIIRTARLAAPSHLQLCGVLNLTGALPPAGQFVKDEDSGHLSYQVPGCRLRRLTPAEALGCMASRNVVVIGDSISRFQYISLAHFLTRGRFQRPYDNEAEGLTVTSASTVLPPPTVTTSRERASEALDDNGSLLTADLAGEMTDDASQGVGASGPEPGDSAAAGGGAAAADAWERFYERTQRSLSRAGCVNTTCRCYRNTSDHLPGEDPLSKAHEYWRMRMTLEDESITQLSMGLVYAFPDFVTAGVNALRWAFTATKKEPDMVLFNMGIWWGYVHSGRTPPEVSMAHVVAAFEEIFEWARTYRASKGLSTRLVYRTSTPVSPVQDKARTQDNFWWKAWSNQIEPLLIPLARAYDWEVFDAGQVVTAAYKQGLLASWDAFHLYPFMYEQINDLLLNSMCGPTGWAA